MSTPTTEFTGFTPEQKALIKQLDEHWMAFSQSNAPAASRYLSEDHIASITDNDLNVLIEWGLVTTGEADYIGKDNGYALTEAGMEIAHHLALEKAVPDYAHAGWQVALQDRMNEIIIDVKKRRQADAKAVADRRRKLEHFKLILERIGVKGVTPVDDKVVYQDNIRFFLKQTIYRRENYDLNYNLINFDLIVERILTPEESTLYDEMYECNNITDSNFYDTHRHFRYALQEYPVRITITPGDQYHFANLKEDFWPKFAKQFAEFVLTMEANWQQLKIEWARYQDMYAEWKAEQERLASERQAEREADRLAALEAEDQPGIEATDFDAPAPNSNPNAHWLDEAKYLKRLINSLEGGYLLDETDTWLLSQVKFARFIDRNVNGYNV